MTERDIPYFSPQEAREAQISDLYSSCHDLWYMRKDAQRDLNSPNAEQIDFETFPIIPGENKNPLKSSLTYFITPSSRDYVSEEDREAALRRTIDVNIRLLDGDKTGQDGFFIAIPDPSIILFMVLNPTDCVLVKEGIQKMSDDEKQHEISKAFKTLEAILPLVKKLPEDVLKNYSPKPAIESLKQREVSEFSPEHF